jgi:integrase
MVPGLRKGRTEDRETAPILPVDDSVVDATLNPDTYLPAIPADMVRLQRFCGCRPEEVCALRLCDLDCSRDVWTYQPESHKTEHHGRERMIFVGPKAQEVLLRYLARVTQSHCFRPCDSEAKRLAEQERNRKTPLSCGNVRRGKCGKVRRLCTLPLDNGLCRTPLGVSRRTHEGKGQKCVGHLTDAR